MTDRWSEPSGGVGGHRFRVWPGTSDSYDHVELTADWDAADAIIGNSPEGDWPPDEGIDGGIYKEIQLGKLNAGYIGEVVWMFRPSTSVPIPDGWEVCDGSVISDHDFPGVAGSVTLPDLVNAYIIGADVNKAIGLAGVAVSNNGVNTSAGAPGPGGTVGSNTVTLTVAEMPSHTHTIDSKGSVTPKEVAVTDKTTKTSATPMESNETGGDDAHENRPRSVGLIPLCRVKWIASL